METCEFVAAQIKEFEADPKIQIVMTMLDWNDRELCFPLDACHDPVAIKVDDTLLCSALLPHREAKGYYPNEMMIRDCVDHYLEMLVRLQNFLDARLIDIDELRPYMTYWIELASGQKRGYHHREVFILFLNYIQAYGFRGAAALIKDFGFNPIPTEADVKEAIEKALANRTHPVGGEKPAF